MLNSGGILTFVANDTEKLQSLGMVMLSEKGGLQLGFGKVELRDLDSRLTDIQAKLDEALKAILLQLLHASKDKDDFIAKVNSKEVCEQLAALEKVLIEGDKKIGEIVSDLAANKDLLDQQSSFDRPPLNKFTVKAIRAAAVREITEEIDLDIKGATLSPDRLNVQDALNRETATNYVRSVLAVEDTSKFSAKEFNNDFESSTFVVTCAVDKKEFEGLTCKPSCQLVQPEEVKIQVVNAEKGMLQTSITGCPPILGGGNQFTVALCCLNIFNKKAEFIRPQASLPLVIPATMFTVEKGSSVQTATVNSSDFAKKK
jgi:hypothetical protein